MGNLFNYFTTLQFIFLYSSSLASQVKSVFIASSNFSSVRLPYYINDEWWMMKLILAVIFYSYEFQHLSLSGSGNGLLALLASLNEPSGYLPQQAILDLFECVPMDEKGANNSKQKLTSKFNAVSFVQAFKTTANTAQFHQSRLIWTTYSFSHSVLLCSLNGWQWSRAVSAQLALWQGVGHSLLGTVW